MTPPTQLHPFVDLATLPLALTDPLEDLITQLLELHDRCEQLRAGVDLVDLLATALDAAAIELLPASESEGP